MQKVYTFWNNENIYQSPASRSVTVDNWTNISSATLKWTIQTNDTFNNVQFNNTTISINKSGTADVSSLLQQGVSNRVVLNYQAEAMTLLFGQAAGNVVCSLTITGSMAANYNTILAQNAEFKAARENNDISDADYKKAIAVQNNQLAALQQGGAITSAQYQAALDAEKINGTEPSTTSGGGDQTQQTTQTTTASSNPLTTVYMGLPLYAWLIIAAVLIAGSVLVIRRLRK